MHLSMIGRPTLVQRDAFILSDNDLWPHHEDNNVMPDDIEGDAIPAAEDEAMAVVEEDEDNGMIAEQQQDDATVLGAADTQVQPMVQDDDIVLPFERNQSPGYRRERRRREAKGLEYIVIFVVSSVIYTHTHP